MKLNLPAFFFLLFTLTGGFAYAQLNITAQANAMELAQKLVGDGVSISNVSFTGNPLMAGFFKNSGGTNINIDSGIVLTNGRAKSPNFGGAFTGVNSNNGTAAQLIDADNSWGLPGDADLSGVISGTTTKDACVLEFDFIPLGDSIRFRYIFSSEEYNLDYVCEYNDAFAFFISGPGFPSLTNIALIPNTTIPVSILNVNNIPAGCVNNPSYYVDNLTNTFFTHDGHTKVLTASARVQPCVKYHLKLVIADGGTDDQYDSGVFLEAKSLTSNAFTLTNLTQIDPATGLSYLVEGCVTGALKIKRQSASSFSQTINLAYGGTAANSIDVQTLPSSVTIPAGQNEVLMNISPIIDLVPEGIEFLKIYTLAPCATGTPTPTDSTEIQIRDYDILGISPDTSYICRGSNITLNASAGYTTYTWDANSTLNTTMAAAAIATPSINETMYYCTAAVGTCRARDSAFVKWKDVEFLSKRELLCKDAANGQIKVAAGPEWAHPVQLSINNSPYQTDSSFNNLIKGNYTIRVKDSNGCVDSIAVTLTQLFPDLEANLVSTSASCTGNPDGKISITPAGGKAPYLYSINNGTSFQPLNSFNVLSGSHNIIIKDNNGCAITKAQQVLFNNDLVVDAGLPELICEGKDVRLNAASNGQSFSWTPTNSLTGSNSASPLAAPAVTTKYYVTAVKGICIKKDSVIVNVNAAPKPNAGADITICYGASTNLNASGAVEYKWSPATYLQSTTDPGTRINKPLDNITYYLNVKDANGCYSLKPDTIKVKVTPAVRMFAGRDTVVAFNQPLQLKAYELGNSGVTRFTWSPSYGLNNPNIANPITRLDRDITYVVTGKTPADCEGSAEIFIKAYKGPEIYVPTAFTPNNDGRNDLLKAIAIGMKEYHYFTIYNRWGQPVFTTKDFTKGWDGKMKGLVQSPGTYVWVAETVDFTGKIVKRNGTTILLK